MSRGSKDRGRRGRFLLIPGQQIPQWMLSRRGRRRGSQGLVRRVGRFCMINMHQSWPLRGGVGDLVRVRDFQDLIGSPPFCGEPGDQLRRSGFYPDTHQQHKGLGVTGISGL